MLVSDYPLFLERLESHVYHYHDDDKKFLFNTFQRIEFLKDASPSLFHRLLYKTREYDVEDGEILLRKDDKITSMLIVKTGEIDIIFETEGTQMVIATVGSGSVINFRNIFIPREKMMLTIRCRRRAKLLILSINELDHLASLDNEFDSKILRFINKLYKRHTGDHFFLDYLP